MTKVTGKGSQLYIEMTAPASSGMQDAETKTLTFDPKSRIGALTSIGESGWTVEEITFSTLDEQSEGVQAVPGDIDFGSISFEAYLDDEESYARLNRFRGHMLKIGVYTQASAAASVKFKGFLTNLKISERTKSDMLMITGEIRVSGALEPMTAADIVAGVQTFATKTTKE